MTTLAAPWRDRSVRAVLAAAALTRVAFLIIAPGATFNIRRYVDPAVDLLRGRFFSPVVIDQLPGAPVVYALLFRLFGESFSAVATAQHLLGLATIYLIIAAAWRAWGPAAGRWAGVVVALQLLLPYQECFMLSETIAEFFLAAALLAAVELRLDASAPARRWLLGGVWAALAGLTRGELLCVGPVLAAALALPGERRAVPRRAWFAFAGGWLILVGGWRVHNQLGGFPGLNAHGPTCLLDSAAGLVRYDLPTFPLAKRILREEDEKCAAGSDRTCSGRLHAFDRLQKEHGYTFLQTMYEIGEIGKETILTQPFAFLPFFCRNFLDYLKPIGWVDQDFQDPGNDVMKMTVNREQKIFFGALAYGPQYFGWIPALLILLLPYALRRPSSADWTVWLMLAVLASVAGLASVFRTVARTQAELYIPAAVVAGRSLDALLLSASRRTARNRSGESRGRA